MSVVIPCYRAAGTIRRTLESIASQTAVPAEVIVVDDASGDETIQVLEDLQALYGRDWIRLFRLAVNSGPSHARNFGWDQAQQPYVAFLDADDAWHPRKIEIQYEWMQARPDVAITANDYKCLRSRSVPDGPLPINWSSAVISRRQLLVANRFSTPCVMIRRDLPYRFPPGKRHSEDYHLWLEIVLGGNIAEKLRIPLTYLFKAPYGDGGLSADLWEAEKGQLDTYRRVYRAGLISRCEVLWLVPFSLLKHVRRCLIVRLRRRESPRGG